MTKHNKKKKCLIYVVTYNHEKFILKTLKRIPKKIFSIYETTILVSDDYSNDQTIQEVKKFKKKCLKLISHKINLGYGGNQKIGYFYAIENNFDYVVLLHGDGQYAPEYLPKIIEEFKNNKNCAVFGSRMIKRGSALKGGMPLYKFVGNRILTFIQNKILLTNLSEFHSGYRAYRVNTLKKIFFELNADDYCFDTDIIIQLALNKKIIKEIPIPTFYGDEISYVNGTKYAIQIVFATLISKIHHLGLINLVKLKIADNKKLYKLKSILQKKLLKTLNNSKKII